MERQRVSPPASPSAPACETYDERIADETAARMSELKRISAYIYDHPETAFHEVKAAETLCDYLERNGFVTQRAVGGLDTAFRATWRGDAPAGNAAGAPPNIAFLAEYDALPELGHGCGHNLIAASGVGSAAVLRAILAETRGAGTITVIGTPAEESGGGKLRLIDAGVFEGVSACVMMHPTSGVSRIAGSCLSSLGLALRWRGQTAHAESHPESGVNALDALHVYYAAASCLRQQLPGDVRIAQIVKKGGVDECLIPDESEIAAEIVSRDEHLRPTTEKIKRCAEGAALATGCTVEIAEQPGYLGRVPNERLAEALREQFRRVGEPLMDGLPADFGTTDFGNVTRIMPCVNPYISLLPERKISNHSEAFKALARGARADEVLSVAVRVMAGLGLVLLTDERVLREAREEFYRTKKAREAIS